MVTEEDYTNAKKKVIELEKDYQEQHKLIKLYEEQQKQVAFNAARIELENKYNTFWKEFYQLAYRAVVSRSGSPEEFMQEYDYQAHKLKSLLRFKITSGDEFLKFLINSGLRLSIENGKTNTCFPDIGMFKDYSDKARMFKKYLNAMFFDIYSKSPQNTCEDLTGYETRRLKWLFSFEMKSERELLTVLYVFGFKMTVSYKAEEVVF
ncbi:MAG: hypothetical protein V4608_03290 [Bacteroidota bacterium]